MAGPIPLSSAALQPDRCAPMRPTHTPPHRSAREGAAGGALAILRAELACTTHTFAPDQSIALEGSERRAIMGVCAGMLRCSRVTPDGRRHIMRFVDPGGLIGLGRLGVFRFTTEAVAPSVVVTFSAHALDLAFAERADVREAVLEALTRELTARDRIQFRLGRLWSDERVADFLLERARLAETHDRPSIALQMSRADIADHLGVTIETVSRALSRFQRDGIVRMIDAHHFTIARPRALAALAEGDGEHFIQQMPERMKGAAP